MNLPELYRMVDQAIDEIWDQEDLLIEAVLMAERTTTIEDAVRAYALAMVRDRVDVPEFMLREVWNSAVITTEGVA